MRRYEFTITLTGVGHDEQEAWSDATEAFSLDPGVPGEGVKLVADDLWIIVDGWSWNLNAEEIAKEIIDKRYDESRVFEAMLYKGFKITDIITVKYALERIER